MVRLPDRPDMTTALNRGRKNNNTATLNCSYYCLFLLLFFFFVFFVFLFFVVFLLDGYLSAHLRAIINEDARVIIYVFYLSF